MINEKKMTVSRLNGLLSAEIFISTGEWEGGSDATPDFWKQQFSAVRASGDYPGIEFIPNKQQAIIWNNGDYMHHQGPLSLTYIS